MIGALLASGITWTATHRLGLGNRLNTSGAAAILSGIWGFDKALNSCLDHVLSLEGSRLQKELATILLTKHSNNPWRMKLVNKHYFSEKVFDDSNLDVPLSRWRRRCLSGDATAVQRTQDTKDSERMMQDLQGATDTVVSRSDVEDFFGDPLDFIFGHPKGTQDAIQDTSSFQQTRRSRGHRRADRRHKLPTTTMNNKNAVQ
eukprot:Gb_23133 [translate_table: standard]